MFKYDGYAVTFIAVADAKDRKRQDNIIWFPTLEEAMQFCADTLGNNSYAKPSPNEDTYLYGPSNGDTTMIVQKHIVGFADRPVK